MKLTVMGIFVADGTPEELSLYSALLVDMLKTLQDNKEKKDIEAEIKSVWDSLKGGGNECPARITWKCCGLRRLKSLTVPTN